MAGLLLRGQSDVSDYSRAHTSVARRSHSQTFRRQEGPSLPAELKQQVAGANPGQETSLGTSVQDIFIFFRDGPRVS
jgi:hypothetical protein